MGRVINTDGPGKRRNQLMRTCAEILHRLSRKNDIDNDVKDMVAMLYYCLHDIDATIDESALAWEKRDYWMKSENFRRRWQWSAQLAGEVRKLVVEDAWETMPILMTKLMPHFADINIAKYTRPETTWLGAYRQLMKETNSN